MKRTMKEHKSYFIDTNIFLRVLVKEDERVFNECFAFLEQVKAGNIRAYTSSLVLSEVNWVLAKLYGFDKTEVVAALKSITHLRNLKISDTCSASEAVSMYEANNVKFIDSMLASNDVFTKKNAYMVSYDRDFDTLGINRKEPKELV